MKNYLSPSTYNQFAKCSAAKLAVERGEWKFEFTAAMKVGSYVDAYFSGTIEQFKKENPDIFTKKGDLRADFVKAESIIEIIKADPLFYKYITDGKMQKKASGKIDGIPFLGYIDNYIPGKAIVDLKVVKDVNEKIFIPETRQWSNWIKERGYITQGAIYQELIRQETGETLPFFIAAIDKKPTPNHELIHIPDIDMKLALEDVQQHANTIMLQRKGEMPEFRCEKCDYCISTKKIKEPITYIDLFI